MTSRRHRGPDRVGSFAPGASDSCGGIRTFGKRDFQDDGALVARAREASPYKWVFVEQRRGAHDLVEVVRAVFADYADASIPNVRRERAAWLLAGKPDIDQGPWAYTAGRLSADTFEPVACG